MSLKYFFTYFDKISISIFTKLFIFNLDKLVSLYVCGIIHTSNPIFVILEIVSETPLIKIEAFSIKFRFWDVVVENSIKYGQKISGHICQGHVDTVSKVLKIKKIDKSKVIKFKISKKFKTFLVEKASILVNGVSLTISKILKDGFEIWVIPHTIKLTNLSNLKKNDLVNIEIDILSKYVKKYINEKK